jgi:electron transfer flavoprotein beta subunit
MKIAVCFKAVPDFDQVVDADWDNFSFDAAWTYVKRVFGCFDESALETALRLRSAWEEAGEAAECTAVTAAPLPSPLCKILFAAGFDRVVDLSGFVLGGGSLPPAPYPPFSVNNRGGYSAPPSAGEGPRNAPLPPAAAEVPLLNPVSPEFRPRHIAAILGNYLGPGAYDLILTGREAGYADTGTVPLFLAEFLGLPALTGVEELMPRAGGLEVKRTSGAGRELLMVRLPLLAALGNSPVSALRAVTLSARMAASRREAEKPSFPGGAASGPGAGTDPGAASRFSREERRKICRFLPAGTELARTVAGIRAEYLPKYERGER